MKKLHIFLRQLFERKPKVNIPGGKRVSLEEYELKRFVTVKTEIIYSSLEKRTNHTNCFGEVFKAELSWRLFDEKNVVTNGITGRKTNVILSVLSIGKNNYRVRFIAADNHGTILKSFYCNTREEVTEHAAIYCQRYGYNII